MQKVSIFNHNKVFENFFDLVILDVPCTGQVYGQRPETIIRINKKFKILFKNSKRNIK